MYKDYVNKKCFFLDLDGTVYLGNKLIDGALDAITTLRKDKKVFFLTNNSSKNRDTYAQKLSNLGILTTKEEIITSSGATAFFLKSKGINKVAVLGTDGLKEELIEAGIEIKDNCDTAVLGFDTSLNYENLCKFTDLIRNGAYYVATHPDFNCPVQNGFIPDVGSFMALIEASTGRKADVVCGKPNSIMAEYALNYAGVDAKDAVMVGDRIYTDIKFGCNNGMTSALVLTGEGTKKELEESGLTADVFGSLTDITYNKIYSTFKKIKSKLFG